MISKTRYNNEEEQRQQEESDEEEYQTDNQYEQDRLTDDNAYSEYFEDDENKGDRFTEDYNEDLRLANCILCETGQVSGSTEKCIEKLNFKRGKLNIGASLLFSFIHDNRSFNLRPKFCNHIRRIYSNPISHSSFF
jgi:hypothetical protein